MPGNLLAKYLPRTRQQDTFIMNGGIHHAPGSKTPPSHKSSNATNITSGSSMDDPETPIDPAQIKFLPKSENQRSNRSWCSRWSKREKYLMFLCAVLFILCIVFVVVAFTRDLQLRSQLTQTSGENAMCLSKACVSTTAQLMERMDFTADPCDDFFQFACGGWNKKHIIPEDKPTYNTFDKLHDDLQIIMRALLEEPKTVNDSESTVKAKVLYKSCLNHTAIELKGDKPLRTVLNDVGGWPVLTPAWTSNNFILEDSLGKLRWKYGGSYLITCAVSADDKNSSVNIIQMKQGSLGMPSREYYLLKEHSSHMHAYRRYMSDIARLLGASGPQVEAQLDDILNFEIKVANACLPHDERQNTGALYNKVTVKEFQRHIPTFDMLRYLRGFILDPLTEDEHIVLFATQYIQDVVKIVHETDKRTVANYIIWRLVMDLAPELLGPFQEANGQYKLVLQGVKRDTVRWKQCVEFVNERMGMVVGAMFLKDNFKKESKETALEMIHNIREAFNELLAENEWMDEKTREFAKEKANAMTERIGYPEYITDPVKLDAKYEKLKVVEGEYFYNILRLHEFDSSRMMEKLRQPVSPDHWDQEPVVVNAFYNPNNNNILFPAGILQPLFYSSTFPKSLNYGGIGVVIGHEITHGFDDKGRQYDKDGNIKQWWDDKTIDAFRERAQCFIDQYSQYKLEQIDQFMNGKITQGENIADNGGLKQSYRAYRKWVEKNGEEPQMPGIGLNHKQLFFLNYAQIWCGKMTDEEALRKIRTSQHSLGPIRVFGPLSNSKDFSKAYNCPLGSRMNPKHKCSVW